MARIQKVDSIGKPKKARMIPKISLHDFESRREEIAKQLLDAAENTGFFVLVNQESPSPAEIEEMFEISKTFFDLPASSKSRYAHNRADNAGWEFKSQIRPSTGLPDQKESLQLQYHRRNLPNHSWPSAADNPTLAPHFTATTARFMQNVHTLSQRILTFFAVALGFPADFFARAHVVDAPDAQSTLRLLHYPALHGAPTPRGSWRAGAHTDFDVLTLLFQRSGEPGLEVCPGREAHTSYAAGDTWTPVEPRTGEIVCNIGDMMMAWSDDRFKSLYHRVRCPADGDVQGERYSIAYFNQANKNVLIQGPKGKYPPLTAQQYIRNAIARNFAPAEETRPEREEGAKL
ncbi:hypothetical protein EDC01DRAFT_320023 [Geopyxis carbonaria]|nr:hypothetical protein EDC01DRAFT_320023 [Geopyxis carbonaria]